MSGHDPKTPTLGSIAMQIRQAAGLSRTMYSAQVNISEADLKAFETNRNPLTVPQRQRILRSQLMRDGGLADLAHAAGIVPPVPVGPGGQNQGGPQHQAGENQEDANDSEDGGGNSGSGSKT